VPSGIALSSSSSSLSSNHATSGRSRKAAGMWQIELELAGSYKPGPWALSNLIT
jgi:hypothetical protein